jgi:chromosome segregation ATPase
MQHQSNRSQGRELTMTDPKGVAAVEAANTEGSTEGQARKRALIRALETARSVELIKEEAVQTPSGARSPSEIRQVLTRLKQQRDQARRSLHCAEATNRLLEETVQTYENKLLDVIAENGDLHQQVDKQQTALFTSKANVANVMRQRNELRDRVEELMEERESFRRALSAAERELVYVNARLQQVSA